MNTELMEALTILEKEKNISKDSKGFRVVLEESSRS